MSDALGRSRGASSFHAACLHIRILHAMSKSLWEGRRTWLLRHAFSAPAKRRHVGVLIA